MKAILAIVIALTLLGCNHAHAQVPGTQGMWETYQVFSMKQRATHRTIYGRHVRKAAYPRAPYIMGHVHRDPMSTVGCLTPKMRNVWALVVAHWGPLRIVSTCRPGAMIRGTHYRSLHASGNAIDFNAPRGHKAEMVRWLHIHTLGGVMTYSNFSHIHIDVGPRFLALNARG